MERLIRVLARPWQVHVTDLEYLPVGFGAHHWRAVGSDHTVYFLALHHLRQAPDTAAFHQLCQALETAHWLRHVRELDFVLAPIRDDSGSVVQRVTADTALAVYPWLACRPRIALDTPDMGHLLARLHASARDVPVGLLRQEDFTIPWRTELQRALANLHRPWESGPYAEAARQHLVESEGEIRDLLAWYDRTAAETLESRPRWVVTHGEPYGPNLVETEHGQSFLVDWDSALLAPRERDLCELPRRGLALSTYTAISSAGLVERGLRLYRAWYHLAETAIYVHHFRQPHRGDLNDATAWDNFLVFVPAYADWPELNR
jgi:fructosamine-3-kinase